MKAKLLAAFFVAICTIMLPAQQYWQPVYNNAGWGSNSNDASSVYTDLSGNIYTSGVVDNANTYSDNSYSIWEWNGTWNRLSDNSNINTFGTNYSSPICGDLNNNIYAIYTLGAETWVAKWNGSNWSLLDNTPWYTTGTLLTINNDQYGNIYAGALLDSVVNNIQYEIYKWNGSTWSQLGAGLPPIGPYGYYNASQGLQTICADNKGNVYVGGALTTEPSSNLFNIMVWNDTTWSAATYNGSLIYSVTPVTSMCADKNGNVYAAGQFEASNYELDGDLIQWNGSQWTQLGPPANTGYVCVDAQGNMYASYLDGIYSYASAAWNVVGNISPFLTGDCYRGYIGQIAAYNGIVYAAPLAYYSTHTEFMLEYTTLQPGQLLAYATTNGSYTCTTPGIISVSVFGGTPPYQYQWSNLVSGDSSITVYDDSVYTVTVTDAHSNQTTAQATVCPDLYSTINIVVFDDANNNCVYDSGEALLPNVGYDIKFTGGSFYTIPSSYSPLTVADTGTFTISVPQQNYCTSFNVCFQNGDSTGYIPAICSNLSGYNIAVTNYVGRPDLTMHVGWAAANPGFGKQYWIMPYNLINNPSPDTVTIVFNYDPNLIYDSAQAPLPTVDVNAHTLTWRVPGNTIPYYTWDWLYERYSCFFTVPAALAPGYVLQSSFVIGAVATDCDSTNNYIYIPQAVTGSFDPNEKDVYPSGNLGDADTVLYYTIFYQNTGTDSTHFITVTDTLSPYLETGTVANLASSNEYSNFTIYGRVLTWTFNPLSLPDSSVSQAGSKGFITFSVNRNSALATGTQISNTASIVFDYNAPVYTNTIVSTIGAPAGLPLINQPGNILVYPNPSTGTWQLSVDNSLTGSELKVFDAEGQIVFNSELRTQNSKLDLNVPSGVYYLRISNAAGSVVRKLVKL